MRKQNINLAGILLFILVIIGINLSLARAQATGAALLGLKTDRATSASFRGESVALGKRTLVADSGSVDALQSGASDVNAEELPDASLELLEA